VTKTIVVTSQGIPGTNASGYAPGGTDVAVADGGTGASSAATARTNLGAAAATDLTAHTGNTSNPHSVTKTQVGLGNVDNVRGIVPIPGVSGHWLQSLLGNAALTSSQNTLVVAPVFIEADIAIDRIAVEVTTGAVSSFVRPVIFGSDADGRPGSLLVDGGQLDASTIGVKEATVAVIISRGLTWWGAVNQGGVPTTRQASVFAGGRPLLMGPAPLTSFNSAFPAQSGASGVPPSPMVPNTASPNVTAVRVRVA
jgi:hypothetical protein